MQGATILVVDDDAAIRDVLAQVLEDEGYRTVTAANGREAIAALGHDAALPDAMLLDLLMPDLDGYAVLEHMRRNLLQEFPVLIFSAQRPGPDILKALDTELRDFVSKPFEIEELLVRLQRLLLRSPRQAEHVAGGLRIYTLGSLRVFRGGALLFDESWRNKHAKTIFKLLFTRRGQRYPKDVLAEELWPDADPDAAANRLRVAVHELRKMLGDGGRGGRAPTIAQQEGAYFFDTSTPYWSDVEAFDEQLRLARDLTRDSRTDEALQAYSRAEALYAGEYLRDDPFFEWSVPMRERLREDHLAMLGDVSHIYATRGEYGSAAGFCRKIVRIEPWREEIYRLLMTYLVEDGRPHEALRAFEECRRALRGEVDADPSSETLDLRDRIAATLGAGLPG